MVNKMDEIFKALSEVVRLRMLSLLLTGDKCVCEIEYSLELTQSNASRHLKVLKKSNILESYKDAQWTFYRFSQKFKEENPYLWAYLESELKQLPTYETDMRRYASCESKEICCNNNSKEQPH